MAYREGRQARRDGVAREANPYQTGPSRYSWDDGWRDTDAILRSLGQV